MMERRLCLVVFAAATLCCLGCSSKPSPSGTVAAARPESPVPAATPEPQFVAAGPIIVENQVDVLAQREGVVADIRADIGKPVRKGDLLAHLDDRQLAAEIEAERARMLSIEADAKNWEAKIKLDETDLSRMEKMWDAQLITKEQLEHARYRVEGDQFELKRERELQRNAEANLRSLELEREKTRITAPFDGIVARRYIRAGQKLQVGDRLFWVTATGPLRVKFTLPERYVGKVKAGDEVTVSPAAAPPEMNHRARVLQVSPVVDPSSGTIEVLAELVGSPAGLRPGMTASIRLDNAK